MRMLRVTAIAPDGTVWHDKIYPDIQDFDPKSWTNRDLAIALDSLERTCTFVEELNGDRYLYEYVGWGF